MTAACNAHVSQMTPVPSGAGLPGASEVAKAEWIEVKQLQNQADLFAAQEKYALGVGELSTILLGKEIQANALLLDDYNARKLARAEGFQVRGSVGLFLLGRPLSRPSRRLSAAPGAQLHRPAAVRPPARSLGASSALSKRSVAPRCIGAVFRARQRSPVRLTITSLPGNMGRAERRSARERARFFARRPEQRRGTARPYPQMDRMSGCAVGSFSRLRKNSPPTR